MNETELVAWVHQLTWPQEPLVHTHGWPLPLACVAVYVVAVLLYQAYGPRERGTSADSAVLRYVLALWNAALCVFSVACAVSFTSRLVAQARVHGVGVVLCDEGGVLWRGFELFCVWAFLMSKFVELGDTALLMLRGRTVPFLHWYHHASVLLYCWHANETHTSLAIPFGTMNAVVHSVMYLYYTLAALGTRPTWGLLVTRIQLLQMALGLAFSCAWAYLVLVEGRACYSTDISTSILAGATLYASYFFLFAQFYVQRWLSNTKAKEE